MAAVNCCRFGLLGRGARNGGGAIFVAGRAELKRFEDGEVAVLQVPGGMGEDGDKLIFDREEDRESIGWNDCEVSAQNAATSGENARASDVKGLASGVKVCASGLNVRFAACTSLSTLSLTSSSFFSEYNTFTGPFSPIL